MTHAMRIGQFQQFLRHASVDIQKYQIFDHLIGGAYPFGEYFQHLNSDFRILHDRLLKITTLQGVTLYLFQRDSIG